MTERSSYNKTEISLIHAFGALILTKPYAEIRITDIVTQAAVARSTFYEYFPTKDAILLAAIEPLFTVLADSVGTDNRAALTRVLAHFYDNRSLAHALLSDPVARRLHRALAQLIIERSDVERSALGARRLAGGQLMLVRDWLGGEVAATADELANELSGSC